MVANWGDRDGLPYFMPYYAATSDPFPFLFMDVADIHVDRPLVHKAPDPDWAAYRFRPRGRMAFNEGIIGNSPI